MQVVGGCFADRSETAPDNTAYSARTLQSLLREKKPRTYGNSSGTTAANTKSIAVIRRQICRDDRNEHSAYILLNPHAMEERLRRTVGHTRRLGFPVGGVREVCSQAAEKNQYPLLISQARRNGLKKRYSRSCTNTRPSATRR